MNMKFDMYKTDSPDHVGGILPVAFDEFGEAWFLLGVEKRDLTVVHSEDKVFRTATFSGKFDASKDQDILDTAAREFFEETMGCFLRKGVQEADIRMKLQRNEQILQLISTDTDTGKSFHLFVLEVPFFPDIPIIFEQGRHLFRDKHWNTLRSFLPYCFDDSELHSSSFDGIRLGCFEKCRIQWHHSSTFRIMIQGSDPSSSEPPCIPFRYSCHASLRKLLTSDWAILGFPQNRGTDVEDSQFDQDKLASSAWGKKCLSWKVTPVPKASKTSSQRIWNRKYPEGINIPNFHSKKKKMVEKPIVEPQKEEVSGEEGTSNRYIPPHEKKQTQGKTTLNGMIESVTSDLKIFSSISSSSTPPRSPRYNHRNLSCGIQCDVGESPSIVCSIILPTLPPLTD